jgi:outer membrane receptor protein involved in Fe transport
MLPSPGGSITAPAAPDRAENNKIIDLTGGSMANVVRPLAVFVRAAGALAAGAVLLAAVAPVALAQPPASRVELEEIVVTAQKREQQSLDVPVAVGTFTQRDIVNTGALTLQQIDDFIPGFEADGETFTQQSYNVRGISSPNISTGGDPSVATFYDEVYLPRAATTVAFADMERVEVLMGRDQHGAARTGG